jgi:ABC-type Fe3+ transport system permease subunit
MNNWMIAILIGAVCGLVLGIKIARDSNAKLAVKGGPLAQIFHYLASASLTGMLPYIVTGLIVGLSFLKLFGTAVGFLALTGIFLLIHAVFERTAATAH